MSSYQKRLCDFFSECKHDALKELEHKDAFKVWKRKFRELNDSLMERMPQECRGVFKQYQEAVSAISGMESDYCYLCGIRDYVNIERQFDNSSGAWDKLVSQMIPSAGD
jgi:hypothetical protein